MYVFMYVCIYVCMNSNVCSYVCIQIYTYMYVCARMYVCMYVNNPEEDVAPAHPACDGRLLRESGFAPLTG